MFKPFTISVVEFANNTKFRIDQIKQNGACRITDLVTGTVNHAHNEANAWKSVCFQADLNWSTNNTSKWRG